MKRKEINIKCRHCNQFHDYKFHSDQVNALNAHWRINEDSESLLEIRPDVGSRYILKLFSSLKLKIDEPFWVLFQNPNSTLNGMENEEDIKDLVFCKSEFIQLLTEKDYIAAIEIKILEIKELNSLTDQYLPTISWWALFSDINTFKKNGRTLNFENYSFISINVQSDLGIDLIIWKELGESRIIAVNDWDFHLNEWNLCNVKLTKEDEENYGIKHTHTDY